MAAKVDKTVREGESKPLHAHLHSQVSSIFKNPDNFLRTLLLSLVPSNAADTEEPLF